MFRKRFIRRAVSPNLQHAGTTRAGRARSWAASPPRAARAAPPCIAILCIWIASSAPVALANEPEGTPTEPTETIPAAEAQAAPTLDMLGGFELVGPPGWPPLRGASQASSDLASLRSGARTTDSASTVPRDERAILIVFWGIWCHSCEDELNEVAQWLRAHPNAPIDVLAVNNDDAEHRPRAEQHILEHTDSNDDSDGVWPFGGTFLTDDARDALNPRGWTPTTLLFGADGALLHRSVGWGEDEREALREALVPLLQGE